MRIKVSLLFVVALLALVLAAPAQATVDRQIATQCFQGNIWANRYNPVVKWNTGIPCSGYVPDIRKPQYTVGRPQTDLYGADRAASHFWPGCSHEWFGVVDNRSFDGSYHVYYHIDCP